MPEILTNIEEVVRVIRDATDDFSKTLPPDGDWEPTLILFKNGSATATHFPMPPNGPMRDFLFETVLPNQIRPQEPDAVVILVSAWATKSVSKEEFDKIEAGEAPMPSERPDRREVIVIQGVSKDGEAGAVGEIKRSEGPPELDWEFLPYNGAGFEGRLLASIRRGVWG